MPPPKRKAAARRAKTAAKPRRRALVRRRRVTSIIHVTEALICFAVLGGIGYGFTQYVTDSPRFKVRSLQIEGVSALSPEAVRAVAGITTDDNLLLLEVEAARRRIEEMAYVRSCTIHRAYPDRIIISIVERVASATLLVNHRAYEIDGEGVVLREIDPLAPHAGPLITEVGGLGFVEVGQQLAQPALDEALAIWRAFSATPLVEEWTLSEIAAPAPGNILMFCDELPFEIRWGREDFPRQAHLLDIWWRAKKDDPLCSEYLDLRFGANSLVCK